MSFVSTLERARDFLLLGPEIDPATVLVVAQQRATELRAKSTDPKAPAIARQAAVRQLEILTPMFPALEIEADMAALETGSAAPVGPQIHRWRLEREKLTARLAALPSSDERTIFTARLAAIQEALHSPPPPPPPPSVDPALAVLAAKLTMLRTALDEPEANTTRLTGLLAEARGVASVLRDEADRQQASDQLRELARLTEALLASRADSSIAADPTEKIIAEKIRALRFAVEKRERSRAPFLLESARDLATLLRVPAARTLAETELDGLALEVEKLLAPPFPDAEENHFAEKLAALRSALAQKDPVRAAALLASAQTTAAAIKAPEVRARSEHDLAAVATDLASLDTEVRTRAQQAAVTEKIAAVRQAVGRRDVPGAQQCLGEARSLAAELTDPAARETALAEIALLSTAVTAFTDQGPLRPPDSGWVLRLIPKGGTAFTGTVPIPLRFVARPRFLLGREESERASRADFLAPKSFAQVGRVNVTLSRTDDEILIQDGDGERKSTNGSKLDEEPLTSSPVPASFSRERKLLLSTVFCLTAQHLTGDAPGGPLLGDGTPDSLNRTLVIRTLSGAMRFVAAGGLPLPVIAVWLFTDATIGSAPACAVPLLHAGLAETHARVHHWQGGFWVENLRSGEAVRLGDHTLAKGETRPLHHAEVLKLGNISYEVQVET